jgi:hypothetical protein
LGAAGTVIEEHGDRDEVDEHGEGEGTDHEVGLVVLYFVEPVLGVDEVGMLVGGLVLVLLGASDEVFGFGDED